jgi:hypothetical protein
MIKFEVAMSDAQRHALVTALNSYLASAAPAPGCERSDMVGQMEELAGMLGDLDPSALNDLTA